MSAEMRERLAGALRAQAATCAQGGSPLYAFLLDRSADDVVAGGPCWEVLGEDALERLRANPALQLMGAVHRLVLTGADRELARFYASVGGIAPTALAEYERAWAAFRETVAAQRETVRTLARRPLQTNEVGRSAALAGGFLTVAGETGLPLRLLEIGASAGLNLRWDAYYYEGGHEGGGTEGASGEGCSWGDPSSPVRFRGRGVYAQGRPPLATPAHVARRAGCDLTPLDASRAEDRLALLSFVWADQTERMRRLRAALDLAAALPVEIDVASAPEWVERQLAHGAPGVATVVFHSIMIGYLSREDRARLVGAIAVAGRRATREAPLAWLRLEGDARDATDAALRLTRWPGGEERLLARCGFHGQAIRWLE